MTDSQKHSWKTMASTFRSVSTPLMWSVVVPGPTKCVDAWEGWPMKHRWRKPRRCVISILISQGKCSTFIRNFHPYFWERVFEYDLYTRQSSRWDQFFLKCELMDMCLLDCGHGIRLLCRNLAHGGVLRTAQAAWKALAARRQPRIPKKEIPNVDSRSKKMNNDA